MRGKWGFRYRQHNTLLNLRSFLMCCRKIGRFRLAAARFGGGEHRMIREQMFPDLFWRDTKWLLPAMAASAASRSRTLSSSGAAIPAASRRPAPSAVRRPRIPPAPVRVPARSSAVPSPVRRHQQAAATTAIAAIAAIAAPSAARRRAAGAAAGAAAAAARAAAAAARAAA